MTLVKLYDTKGICGGSFEVDAAGLTAFKSAFAGGGTDKTHEVTRVLGNGNTLHEVFNLGAFGSYDYVEVK